MPPLKFQSPEGQVITIDSPDGSIPTEQELDQLFSMAKSSQPEPKVGFFGKVPLSKYQEGERNIMGNIVDRPAAALRAAIQSIGTPGLETPIEAFKRGSINPTNVPTFQDLALDKYYKNGKPSALKTAGGYGVSAAGLAADLATNPANLLMSLIGKAPIGEGKTLGGTISQTKPAQALKSFLTKERTVGETLKPVTSKVSQAVETIKNIPDRFFRGGLTKQEALRVETEYGSSNGSLVEIVKNKLKQGLSYADDMYNKVFKETPENKFINIKPSIEEAGSRLKRLGLITKNGNLTELGKSEIAKDTVYGKLLDFYQSADAISGVENLQGKGLTQSQIIRAMRAERETLVNKDQFLFLRDKLNSLYKNKPSDIDVSKVVDKFYQSGENSGLKGLQVARNLEREAFQQESKFLNRNTGDLKIATENKLNRIGTDKPLSRQEMQHIEELQQYIKHPIIDDAAKINKLNSTKASLLRKKDILIGTAIGVGSTAVGLPIAKRLMGQRE